MPAWRFTVMISTIGLGSITHTTYNRYVPATFRLPVLVSSPKCCPSLSVFLLFFSFRLIPVPKATANFSLSEGEREGGTDGAFPALAAARSLAPPSSSLSLSRAHSLAPTYIVRGHLIVRAGVKLSLSERGRDVCPAERIGRGLVSRTINKADALTHG